MLYGVYLLRLVPIPHRSRSSISRILDLTALPRLLGKDKYFAK